MEAKEILSLQRGLAYTAPEVKTLKIYGILGEGLDGLLHRIQMNPKLEKERYSNPESQKRINDLIQIVNQYRSSLRKIILTNQKKKLKEEDFSEYQKMLQLEYYNSVESGEYFERGKGKWEKKE
jgi:glutamine synthetase